MPFLSCFLIRPEIFRLKKRTRKYRLAFCCRLMLISAGLSGFYTASAQCIPDHFFHQYNGNKAVYPGKIITGTANEIIVAGSVLNFNNEIPNSTDGWIAVFSARGTFLWSKQYFINGYNSGGWYSVEKASDSSYLVSGRFGRYKKAGNGSIEELDAVSVVAHLDRFGNLIWMRRLTNFSRDSFLDNIIRTSDNSFIISGSIMGGSLANMLIVLRTDSEGNIQWHRVLREDSTALSSNRVVLLKSGELLLTGSYYKTNRIAQPNMQGYYLITMSTANGSLARTKAVAISAVPGLGYAPVNPVRRVAQTNGDTLYFYTSFSDQPPLPIDPYTRHAAVLAVNTEGRVFGATGFQSTEPGCALVDASYNGDGTHTLLADDGQKSFLTRVALSGNPASPHAYTQVDGNLRGLHLPEGSPSNRILFGGRSQVAMMGLMKTEPDGSIPCMEGPVQIRHTNITSWFRQADLPVFFFNTAGVDLESIAGGIGTRNYTFNKTTLCIQSCCDNIASDTSFTALCDAREYRLPDNKVVRQSGLYYTNHRTRNNCDSIAFHDVQFLSSPLIDLGEDTCFGQNSSLVLKADSGYTEYRWSGIAGSGHSVTVTQPGLYKLTATNRCGTGSDEVEVFTVCNPPVYMPTAFTPNGDGLNDLYRYPRQNKNRFIRLRIYNREGKIVFTTRQPTQGWNGTYKGVIQPAGTYAFMLELQSLDGKPLLHKGTFTLIR